MFHLLYEALVGCQLLSRDVIEKSRQVPHAVRQHRIYHPRGGDGLGVQTKLTQLTVTLLPSGTVRLYRIMGK